MRSAKFTKIKQFFQNIPFLKKLKIIDIYFFIIFLAFLYPQLPSIEFIYKSNIIVLYLTIPLIIIFIWVWIRSNIDKGNLLSSASIIFAVFIFLVSLTLNIDSKIKLLADMNTYNCTVAQDILALNNNTDLSRTFILHYFIFQPYLDNTSFILQRLSTSTGIKLLSAAYDAESANGLISQTHNLNIQMVNPSLIQVITNSTEMYNRQIIEIASSTSDIFCRQLF